jgi:hypothetical protein
MNFNMKFNMKKILIALTAVSSFGLTTCAAYDLGKDGTTYYKIDDPENATWNEVSFIVKDKCATCHTDEKPWYKPANTPEKPNAENPNFGLNKIGLEAFFDERNSLMLAVKLCIESEDSKCGEEQIPMPPKYATQLDDNERQALLAFVNRYIPAATIELSAFFKQKCAGCHGPNGDGKNGSTGIAIGGSKSDTFEKFKNAYETLPPMPGVSNGYPEEDARSDWQKITGKTN